MSEDLCLICDNILYAEGEQEEASNGYCSEECRRIDKLGYTLSDVIWLQEIERQRQVELAAQKNEYSIIEICRKADAAGMSYGKYVAKHKIR